MPKIFSSQLAIGQQSSRDEIDMTRDIKAAVKALGIAAAIGWPDFGNQAVEARILDGG